MSPTPTKRVTVRLPEDLVAKARRKALADERTLTALIEEGLRRVIAEPALDRPMRRIPLPVSSATGGLAPGIDIEDSASLQEMDDLEYVERLRKGFA
jgi:hypothetical protein